MAGKPQLSSEVKNEILQELKNGASFNSIKERVKVSLYTIHHIAKKHSIERKVGVPKGERHYKYERLCSHYFFTGSHQADSFIENCF